MPDPQIPLHCPKCPLALVYLESLTSQGGKSLDTHLYTCPEHGGWRLQPSGLIKLNNPSK